jgi:hypothetical protein
MNQSEKRRAWTKKWRANNPDKVREYNKKWLARKKEKEKAIKVAEEICLHKHLVLFKHDLYVCKQCNTLLETKIIVFANK